MDSSKFDTYIKNTIDSWNCPGVAIAVVQGDEVVYQRALGFRDVQKQLPLTEDTRFALASVTKSFTAMSAALLVDDGLLEWDKPVWHYMPEFILDDPYITHHVTLRDMLSHRTGLPRHDFAAWRLDLPRGEFIKRMRHLKFSATFREKYQYNNLMYAAVGYLVEKIANQRWEDFVDQRIFAPLGMMASNFDPTFRGSEQLLAQGYRIDHDDEGKFEKLTHMPFGIHTELSPGPAGALFSTLSDLTHWLKVHINQGKYGDAQLVSPKTLKQMHSPQMVIPTNDMAYALSGLTMLSYGMGWMMRPYPFAAGTLISHGGNVEGHSLEIAFVPESKVGVVVLTNAAGSSIPTILLREAIERVLDLPSQDWNAKFHKIVDPLIAAAGRGKKTTAQDKLADALQSHALEAYQGVYSADGYPDFSVKIENGQLYACTLGSLAWSELRHYHYEVFEWHLSLWDDWIKAKFSVDDTGDISAVSIPLAIGVPDIVFTRTPLALGELTLSAIAGEYDSGIDGLIFSVSHKNGKLYWQESEQVEYEVKPCHECGSEVECQVNRSRVVFIQADGVFKRLILKTPDGTYEASRHG
jgi:CubicO group peptidase (beta-lactamase class C family)